MLVIKPCAVCVVCCRASGETQQTLVKIMTLASMAAYVFRLTAGPSANAETSTLKEYFARKVGTFFFQIVKFKEFILLGTSLTDHFIPSACQYMSLVSTCRLTVHVA